MNQNSDPKWDYIVRDGCRIYQSGSHINGNFIRVYTPENFPSKNEKVKAIIYLHGFALCMPKFYQDHIYSLVKQGYFVFFPDFQRSDYPDDVETEEICKETYDKNDFNFWLTASTKVLTTTLKPKQTFERRMVYRDDQLSTKEQDGICGSFEEPSLSRYRQVSIALVVLLGLLNLIAWFRRNYGKNLIRLISTVGWSLAEKPPEWIKHAITLTENAWRQICSDNPTLALGNIEFYMFGHSLGGLLALSWPYYVQEEGKDLLAPKQILVADPAPSTEMGIPWFGILILKLFRSPFAREPITIGKTGPKLNVPLGILHGVDDKLVKPQTWVEGNPSNFHKIASTDKAIYFSLSNHKNTPPLIAFHNQAVTDTTYFDDDLFENFGGVKDGPNAYNGEFIWPGFDFVLSGQASANSLLTKFPVLKIQVTDTLPEKNDLFSQPILRLAIALIVLGFGYWLLRSI